MAKNPDYAIPTRPSLIKRLKNWEDQQSWQDFFDTYRNLIYAVALKAGLNDAEAQEVVQETAITMAKTIRDPGFEYDPAVGSFKGLLLNTTGWRITDQFNKRQPAAHGPTERGKETNRTATIERIPDPKRGELEGIWEEEWTKNIFDAALERVKRVVSAKQYQIFDFYVIKQWPALKVAQTLGINIGSVFLAKHRVSARLKREIQRLEKV